MRLPVIDGDDSRIDEAKAEELVDYAIKQGINYFDTAWGYHGGNSEKVLGKILKKYPRESYFLSNKFPGYDRENIPKVEEIFEEQLKRCGVDYFDFYFFHNVAEKNIDAYLDEQYGIFDYLSKQKELGRIRYLGFSAHGGMPVLQRFLDAYGSFLDFGMFQINYLDWDFQNAKEKVALLKKYNIPVWVMEPLRGGSLAKLPEEHTEKLKALRPEESVPGWAFRFIQSIPEVTMTLSGMSDLQQLQENIAIYQEEKPLNRQGREALFSIAREMLKGKTVPCTECKYCLTYCERALDIPMLLALYNENNFSGGGFLAPMALEAVPKEKHPDACIACQKCEEVCPQQIKISEALAALTEQLKPQGG